MREIVQAPRLPRRQLPVDRAARAGDAAADQRLQPARHQRARAATSGTTSRRRPTRTCRRSARSRVHDPFTGEPRQYAMPAGGRGYTRAPSLISLWSTAPFLLNNTVGKFDPEPSVEARMSVVRGLDRADAVAGEAREGLVLGDKVPRHRSTAPRSAATSPIPAGFVPEACSRCRAGCDRWLPWLVERGRRHRARPDPRRACR